MSLLPWLFLLLLLLLYLSCVFSFAFRFLSRLHFPHSPARVSRRVAALGFRGLCRPRPRGSRPSSFCGPHSALRQMPTRPPVQRSALLQWKEGPLHHVRCPLVVISLILYSPVICPYFAFARHLFLRLHRSIVSYLI